MKSVVGLASKNHPQLIPVFKKTERKLLSVLMATLEIVPEFRGEFYKLCGYSSGKTCQYQSFMEPRYEDPNLPKKYPDGLITCTRGNTNWCAFLEAKSDKFKIKPEQIQEYTDLGKRLGIDAVISISNEFAREPTELPYHLATSKKKGLKVFHLSWPEIRTTMGLFIGSENTCNETEIAVLKHAFNYLMDPQSGVLTFDAMPTDWKKFVEAASTELGFSTNTSGLIDIVHGWQQERRDLCAKINGEFGGKIELRHPAGVRATLQECTTYDKKLLANDYKLSAGYFFKRSKCSLQITADLRACRQNFALEMPPPKGLKAKGAVTRLSKTFSDIHVNQLTILFKWPGRVEDSLVELDTLFRFPDTIYKDKKDGPKSITLISSYGIKARFRSQKRFIEDLEETALNLLRIALSKGFLS